MNPIISTCLTICASVSITACGGSGGSSNSGGSNTAATPAVVTPVAATCQPLEIRDQAGNCTPIYAVTPDATTCQAGVLSEATRQNALSIINEIRRLHELDAVVYDYASDNLVMNASLMMLANNTLNHSPPTTWKCYSAAGAMGANTSNLASIGAYSLPEDDFILWLTDRSNLSGSIVGHRRWLLDPFLGQMAFGRAGNMAAIRVIYDTVTTPKSTATFVAYPFHDYPVKYYAQGTVLSFSVIADSNNKAASARVDFSAAQISVAQRGGSVVGISNVNYDNAGYGLANNLQFSAGTLAYNMVYDVTISNVLVSGQARSYSYWFRVVQ